MKKIILLAFMALLADVKSQVVFEHKYDTASTFVYGGGGPAICHQLMMVDFELSGQHYVRLNRLTRKLSIYNLNHALTKTIDLSTFPFNAQSINGLTVLYLSEQLFDTDPGIEFMYLKDPGQSTCYTGIYNEDGSLIFSDSACPLIQVNVLQQQYPIYNTSQGTKMILSYPGRNAKVFGLAGTLSAGVQAANNSLVLASGMLSSPAPNPAISSTKIDYALPQDMNEGLIVFYDLQGTEIKRYHVDRTFDYLLVSTADIVAGTYFYQLQTSGNTSSAKKLVVLK